MKTRTPTQEQYEKREIGIFLFDLSKTEKLSKHEKLEAKAELKDLLETPCDINAFTNNVDYLVTGSYGAGAQIVYRTLSKRQNRKAWLFITMASLNYQVSKYHACKLWNELSTTIQDEINKQIEAIISDNDDARIEESEYATINN